MKQNNLKWNKHENSITNMNLSKSSHVQGTVEDGGEVFVLAAPAFFCEEKRNHVVFVTLLAVYNACFNGCRMGLSQCGRMKGIDEVVAG